jgi:hypothetical protein
MAQTGVHTPWGPAEYISELVPGILSVSVEDHGGILLDHDHNERVPLHLRRESGWYHEDCEWSAVFVIFEEELCKNKRDEYWTTLKRLYPMNYVRFKDLDNLSTQQLDGDPLYANA